MMGDIGRETVIKVKFEEEDMLHINKMFLKIQLRKTIFSKSSKIFFGIFAGIIILSMLILMLAGNSGVPSEVSNVSADDSSMIDKIVPGVIFVSGAILTGLSRRIRYLHFIYRIIRRFVCQNAALRMKMILISLER